MSQIEKKVLLKINTPFSLLLDWLSKGDVYIFSSLSSWNSSFPDIISKCRCKMSIKDKRYGMHVFGAWGLEHSCIFFNVGRNFVSYVNAFSVKFWRNFNQVERNLEIWKMVNYKLITLQIFEMLVKGKNYVISNYKIKLYSFLFIVDTSTNFQILL